MSGLEFFYSGCKYLPIFSEKLSLIDFSVHFSAVLSQHKPVKVRQGQLLKEQHLR